MTNDASGRKHGSTEENLRGRFARGEIDTEEGEWSCFLEWRARRREDEDAKLVGPVGSDRHLSMTALGADDLDASPVQTVDINREAALDGALVKDT